MAEDELPIKDPGEEVPKRSPRTNIILKAMQSSPLSNLERVILGLEAVSVILSSGGLLSGRTLPELEDSEDFEQAVTLAKAMYHHGTRGADMIFVMLTTWVASFEDDWRRAKVQKALRARYAGAPRVPGDIVKG